MDEDMIEYPFTLRQISLRHVGKFAGPRKYESKETGFAFATFGLNWPGTLLVAKQDDPMAMMAEAVKQLTEWANGIGLQMGREVVMDIGLDRADAALGDDLGADAEL